jgi:dynein intermediate chain
MIGTQNAHNIITVSTDGKLCNWNLDMLKEPMEAYDLHCGASKTVAATCLAFPYSDTGAFLAGSEEGIIYPFTRQGPKADVGEPFLGHSGPVTVCSEC